ncbi:hypothetical protein KSF_075280 [Reticulibacter mediterranei]|uniref:Carrier domain-containing protein n=1 Tax=Reticulibacter mediterranei TaxID=2778369 RepID=A0A8J3N6K0_9CHLR|nr:non-ribosomal peptide synthetase [Reticulibacter mediterranei]GHO97480.1 hypothetical protein KSF_075280 [Reticulibacter mediterranei]
MKQEKRIRIHEISQGHFELFKYLLADEGVEREQETTIHAQLYDGPFVLSFAQEQMWLLHQLNPESAVYNVPFALRLRGSLKQEVLEQSLNEIVQRHAILRSIFPDTAGRVQQVVLPSAPISLRSIDLSSSPEAAREDEALKLIQNEVEHPFDLASGPLLRATLLSLDEQSFILILVLHHIISDRWSLGNFVREISTLYLAFLRGEASALKPLPIQFIDYAEWQRASWEGDAHKAERDYWLQQLADAPLALELPTMKPRPMLQTFCGATYEFEIPTELLSSLRLLSQQEGVTLFMLLLGAFQTLLLRYTGQQDILVGCPIANRDIPELESLIGVFINTLIIRTRLSGDLTFLELLARVKEVATSAYQHQHIPFGHLVKQFEHVRDVSRNPLVQVMFVHHSMALPTFALPDLELSPLVLDTHTAKVDLTLYIEDEAEKLKGAIEYNTDLFDRAFIASFTLSLQMLLKGIAYDSRQRLSALPVHSPLDKYSICKDYRAKESLHALFEEQVERTPEAVAVVYEDAALSYGELNRQANQLARYLQQQGVGPEVRVGLFLERSLELVIALLAILKAGGAYVPLDPTYPAARLRFMIQDAAVPFILSTEGLRQRLPEEQAGIVCVEKVRSLWKHSGENLHVVTTGENLAYVIYTSGSTGQPKGVMNTHAGICNHMLWIQTIFMLVSDDRLLQKTPYSFDASIWEFFLPLLSGAQLVMAYPGRHQDPQYLIEAIKRYQITHLQLVPTMLKVWLEEPGLEQCQGIRRLICSGEALSPQVAQTFFERLPGQLHNLYGPTEVAVDVTHWECSREAAEDSIPIGQPIANTDILILDQEMALVPLWATGEIYIRGKGLARGYHGRSDLTAASFVPDPFREGEGGRLYKTGDLGRYREDGSIEYLGRVDQQVKIRGFRIELGEIEYTLCQHPAVQDAVVLQREDNAGNKSLIAYILVEKKNRDFSGISINSLRSFLKQRLPEYMIPASFTILEELPLTPSGKINRSTLPAPDGSRPILEEAFIQPRTQAEQRVIAVWKQILGLEQIGVYDDFFALGGDSILSVQVAAILVQEGFACTPRHLFQYATAASLAAAIEKVQEDENKQTDLKTSEQKQLSSQQFNTSDFPAARLEQQELERFLRKITKEINQEELYEN